MKTVFYYDSGKWQSVLIAQEFNTVNLSAQLGPWYDNVPIKWIRQNVGIAQTDLVMPRRTLRGLGIPVPRNMQTYEYYTGTNPPPGTYGGQEYVTPTSAPATFTEENTTPVVQAVITPTTPTSSAPATTPTASAPATTPTSSAPATTPATTAAVSATTPAATQNIAPAQVMTDTSDQSQSDYIPATPADSGISYQSSGPQNVPQSAPSTGIPPIMLLLGTIAAWLALT